MTTPIEQFAEFNGTALTSVVRVAETAVNGIERLADFQLASAQSAIEDSATKAKAFEQVKDLQEFATLHGNVAAEGAEAGVAYARNVYELTAAIQSELTTVVTDNLGALNQALVGAVEKGAESVPAGGDLIVAAIKSQVATTTAAAESITKAAKQVADFADARVKAAADATTAAVRNTKAKRAA